MTTIDDDAETTDNPADNVGGPIEATDADDDTPTYALSGADAAMFRVRSNGQIEVSDEAMLNYESKNTYMVTLTADDGYGGSNNTATIAVTIHVTGVDEAPMIRDRADSSAMGEQVVPSYVENGEGPVLTLSATDPEKVTPIVWGFLENADGVQNLGIFTDAVLPIDGLDDSEDDVAPADVVDFANFEIEDGVLTFAIGGDKEPPDFENPVDADPDNADPDNEYKVVVQASDGGTMQAIAWFKVTVMVTNEEEDGKVSWTVDHNVEDDDGADTPKLMQFQAGAKLVASVTDGDGPASNIRWQWYRSSSETAQGTAISGATLDTYTVTDSPADTNDLNKYLRVKVIYNVGSGPDETAFRVSDYQVRATRSQINIKPEFAAAVLDRRVTEGKEGMTVGAPVRATDTDNDVLNYVLLSGGDSGKFKIDQETGQITVGDDGLDYEAGVGANAQCEIRNICSVMVNATDSAGEDADTAVTVTITITDLNEKPTFTAGVDDMEADHAEGNTAIYRDPDPDPDNADVQDATYAATDPEGGSVTLSLMGDDKDMFMLTAIRGYGRR